MNEPVDTNTQDGCDEDEEIIVTMNEGDAAMKNSSNPIDISETTTETRCNTDPEDESNDEDDSVNDDEDESANEDEKECDIATTTSPPRHFLCPISQALLIDPVIDGEGNVYERTVILRWLVLGVSPITGNPLCVSDLRDDDLLRRQIDRWKENNGNIGSDDDDGVESGGEEEEENDTGFYYIGVDNSARSSGLEEEEEDDILLRGSYMGYEANKITTKAVMTDKNNDHEVKAVVKEMIGSSASCSKNIPRPAKNAKEKKPPLSLNIETEIIDKSSTTEERVVVLPCEENERSRGSPGITKSSSARLGEQTPTRDHRLTKSLGSEQQHNNWKVGAVPILVSSLSEKKSATTLPSTVPVIPNNITTVKKSSPPPPPPRTPPPPTSRKPSVTSTSSATSSSRNNNAPPPQPSAKLPFTSNFNAFLPPPPPSAKHSSTRDVLTLPVQTPKTDPGHHHRRRRHLSESNIAGQGVAKAMPPPPLVITPTPTGHRKQLSNTTKNSDRRASSKTSLLSSSSYSMDQDLTLLPPIGQIILPKPRHNGWTVPLGVHKIICAGPGLRVSTHVHRRSLPVIIQRHRVLTPGLTTNRSGSKVIKEVVEEVLIIPTGRYVDILETQIHGDRVRGRICWEEEGEEVVEAKKKGGGITKRTSRMIKRTAITVSRGMREREKNKRLVKKRYEGWISLQWAKDDRNVAAAAFDDELDEKKEGTTGLATDEDSGPWVSHYSLFTSSIS